MLVTIDNNSGFCYGVKRAIARLEEELAKSEKVYCVGDIVHNEREIERLQTQGLEIIDINQLKQLHNASVLFRAHGEPPSSYAIIKQNNLTLSDATCPVVLRLQSRMREAWEHAQKIGGQIALFGKKGHAEVIGLMGQTDNKCILIESPDSDEQIALLDPNRHTEVFSQTTKDPEQYERLIAKIHKRVSADIVAHNTICTQMSTRAKILEKFAREHEMILFVGGAKSSNSKVLFEICKGINPNSYFVTSAEDVSYHWFQENPKPASVGIFGATSTPLWLMEDIRKQITDNC